MATAAFVVTTPRRCSRRSVLCFMCMQDPDSSEAMIALDALPYIDGEVGRRPEFDVVLFSAAQVLSTFRLLLMLCRGVVSGWLSDRLPGNAGIRRQAGTRGACGMRETAGVKTHVAFARAARACVPPPTGTAVCGASFPPFSTCSHTVAVSCRVHHDCCGFFAHDRCVWLV